MDDCYLCSKCKDALNCSCAVLELIICVDFSIDILLVLPLHIPRPFDLTLGLSLILYQAERCASFQHMQWI